ncbi:MAG: cadherin repeat domain-containing protein [Candidatus Aminicenantes bacterium]|jgi:hypothetical protein
MKNYISKIMIIGMLMVLVAVTFFCSKKEEKTDQYQVKPRKIRTHEPAMARVELEPREPTSLDDIQANAALKDPGMKRVKFQYQWFVNGEVVQENENPRLEKQHYKKGDIVYCRVKATRGIYESKIVKSKEIKIKNSIPLITLVPWDDVQLGDRFHYTIQARDPDNDPLTYHLVSPLDLGIKLDPNTGEIRWDTRDIPQPEPIGINKDSDRRQSRTGEGFDESEISKASPRIKKRRQPPAIVKIVFEVNDPDGGTAVSSLRLNLTQESGIPQ